MIINVEQASGVQSVWLAERIILHKQAQDENSTAQVEVETDDETIVLASYHSIKSGSAYVFDIDVTDIVRAYNKETTSFSFEILPSDDAGSIVEMVVAGLVNPENVLIPDDERGVSFATIQPPSVIIRDEKMEFATQLVEVHSQSGSISQFYDDDWHTETLAGINSVEIASETEKFQIRRAIPRLEAAMTVLQGQSCGKRYAMAEWESFTGTTRRHIMEIGKQNARVNDAYSLLHIDNGYKTIKGHIDGFSLRLEGLSRYDVWYYSDILLSSRVRVTIDGVNWYDVDVEADDYTLNEGDGGEFSTIEIPIKFRKYDAVSMQ